MRRLAQAEPGCPGEVSGGVCRVRGPGGVQHCTWAPELWIARAAGLVARARVRAVMAVVAVPARRVAEGGQCSNQMKS